MKPSAGADKKVIAVALVLWTIALVVGLLSGHPVHATEQVATSQNLLVNQINNGTVAAVGAAFMPKCRESAVYISWSSGASSGAVTVESANDVAYTGTWAPLTVVSWTAGGKQDIVQITGVHNAIRTRISTVIGGGGTVSTFITCN